MLHNRLLTPKEEWISSVFSSLKHVGNEKVLVCFSTVYEMTYNVTDDVMTCDR